MGIMLRTSARRRDLAPVILRLVTAPTWSSTAATFAQSILKRHGGRDECSQPLDRVFQFLRLVRHFTRMGGSALGPGSGSQLAHFHNSIYLAPRLNLTMLMRPSLANLLEPRLRVVSHQRIEASGAALAVGSGRANAVGPALTLSSPVPHIVRRTAPGVTGEDEHTGVTSSAPSSEDDRPRIAMARNPRKDEAMLPDLNRLTEQVIQAIDHRIIAHRERLGRI